VENEKKENDGSYDIHIRVKKNTKNKKQSWQKATPRV
jgi:hypothetical protein